MAEKSIDKNSNKPTAQIPIIVYIFLSAVFGFAGGWFAVENLQADTILVGSNASQKIISGESDLIADIAEKLDPSVVTVNVTSSEVSSSFFFGEQFFETASEGSGIILSEAGLVVTNKHVIPESTTQVTLVLADGREFDDVEVIGRDPFNDIAFLRINNPSNLTPAILGDSLNVRVGDKVVAVGNALGEFDNTVTAGIISGISRPIVAGLGAESEQLQNLFQTDAAINPGNSGGPLVNTSGEVIGINTAVAGGDAQNIGFSIPINDVKPGIKSIQETGKYSRPYLGVRYISLDDEIAEELELEADYGAYIQPSQSGSAILPDSPAAKAGLKAGDIILMVEDTKIDQDNPLVTTVSKFQVGAQIELTILRGSETISVPVTLEAADDL